MTPSRVRIKVCGVTSVADALAAAAAGVDAIGLNLAEGPRKIDPATAGQIVRALPPLVVPVALFVNAQAEDIRRTAAALGVAVVQLHGEEPPETVAGLAPLRVVKAFRLGGEEDAAAVEAFCRACEESARPAALLLDARVVGQRGGTGRTFDWRLAAKVRALGPVILAGGLGPDNVAEAICAVRPYAVDACSGVESAPGRKDQRKVAAFVAAVRAAETEA